MPPATKRKAPKPSKASDKPKAAPKPPPKKPANKPSQQKVIDVSSGAPKAALCAANAAIASGAAVVLIHSPFCGYCVNMMPSWQSATAGMSKNASVVSIESSAMGSLSKAANLVLQASGLGGVPHIFGITSDGKQRMYDGDRSKQSFVDFSKALTKK